MFPGDSETYSRGTVGHVPGGQWDMFLGDSGTCSQEIVGDIFIFPVDLLLTHCWGGWGTGDTRGRLTC